MGFQVLARTLLHLGAELISSDDIALAELVKNSFDAGSKSVHIEINCLVPRKTHAVLMAELATHRLSRPGSTVSVPAELRDRLLSAVDTSSPRGREIHKTLAAAPDVNVAYEAFAQASAIIVRDKGDGMSLHALKTVYLTIGTRSRRIDADARSERDRPYLGEKGVGRLSTMRLGSRLIVRSTQAGESHWNELDMDWAVLSHDSDALLADLEIAPKRADEKDSVDTKGTVIRVSALSSDWSEDKVLTLARRCFGKLTDPFEPRTRFPVHMRFNGAAIPIPGIERALLDRAHAKITAQLLVKDEHLRWELNIDYKGRTKAFEFEDEHVGSVSGAVALAVLHALGPFTMEAYWYNRRLVPKLESIGEVGGARELINFWAGGLLLYRDGFRVMPYADPEDDWLSLDPTALASPGYKVNRKQIIGRVRISSATNPELRDQTNREGLRSSDESQALRSLLQDALKKMRGFLNEVDNAERRPEPEVLDEITERINAQEERIDESLSALSRHLGKDAQSARYIRDVRDTVKDMHGVLDNAKELAESYSASRSDLLHLAGLGLVVEVLAHELHRALAHALESIGTTLTAEMSATLRKQLESLDAQLKTLRRRLSVIDPLSVSGRQRKQAFDLTVLVRDTVAAHEAQFSRHKIAVHVEGSRHSEPPAMTIKAVKGMVIQILENLISNSVYWTAQRQRHMSSYEPEIRIQLDPRRSTLQFSDNGPGIDKRLRDDVFRAFFSTKPAGEGKGLGLYIAREIAEYHGAALELEDSEEARGSLHTFILRFPEER